MVVLVVLEGEVVLVLVFAVVVLGLVMTSLLQGEIKGTVAIEK